MQVILSEARIWRAQPKDLPIPVVRAEKKGDIVLGEAQQTRLLL